GEDLLGRFFSPVRMLLYKDELVFHRAEPVVAYLLSEQGINQSLTEQERQHLVALIKQKLVRARTLNVSREKGLFLAWKPASAAACGVPRRGGRSPRRICRFSTSSHCSSSLGSTPKRRVPSGSKAAYWLSIHSTKPSGPCGDTRVSKYAAPSMKKRT